MKKLLTLAILCFISIFAVAAVSPTASSNSNPLTPLSSKIFSTGAEVTTFAILFDCTKTVTVELYSGGVFIKSFSNTSTSASCSGATTTATNTGKKQAEDYAAAQGLGPVTWPPPTIPD